MRSSLPMRRASVSVSARCRSTALAPASAASTFVAARPSLRIMAAPANRRHSRGKASTAASSGRSAAVIVQANLFARIARVFRSFAENIVSSAEDPEKILDTVVLEMQGDLTKMRQAAAQVLASQKMLDAKYKQAQTAADEWLRRAELAVSKGDDTLAKEALRRRKAQQDQADSLKAQVAMQQAAVDSLLGNTRLLESKLTEARSKKETLKARAASAKTSQQIQEMISGLNSSNAAVAFDKMEEKVLAMEAEYEGTVLLTAGEKGLENQFAALEAGTVDDELAALKRGLLKAPASSPLPVTAMVEGRPLRDAIDLELDQLRRKARE